MSRRAGLVEGAKRLLRRSDRLEQRVAGLEQVVEHGRDRLPEDVVGAAAAVVARARRRLDLAGSHTVVALAGATGSGKSSTFNALAGVDLATVGVRRPTTSHPTACVWGEEPADELLDWLEVPPRHRALHGSSLDDDRVPDPELDGLVLVDLPDHDSTEVGHHLQVERLVGMTDLVVWLLDPQKYADAAVHRRFLEPMAAHRDVFLVVLNRIDEVAPAQREAVLADVRRLLDADGLTDVPLLAASARTGEGLDALRSEVAARVAGRAGSRARLAADVDTVAARLREAHGDAEPLELRPRDRRGLHDAMAEAAGVPVVVAAVERATTARGRQATGWPVTSWLGRMRPDPLRRLRLDTGTTGGDVVVAARSSMPATGHVGRARLESAVREVGSVGEALGPAWSRAVRTAAASRLDDLEDRLDDAVGRTDLGTAGLPWWCRPVQALQWALLAAAVVGAVWLGVLAVMGFLQLPAPTTPDWRGVPLPTGLLVGGVLLGWLLALLSRALLGMAARRRARRAESRLRTAVTEVADELVVGPVSAELEAHRLVTEGLRGLGR